MALVRLFFEECAERVYARRRANRFDMKAVEQTFSYRENPNDTLFCWFKEEESEVVQHLGRSGQNAHCVNTANCFTVHNTCNH
jgi:hypothetical protein